MFRQIAGLQDRLPGFVAVHTGPNVSPETAMDQGFSGGFILDFLDAEARDLYLVDPEHRRIGDRIVASAEGGTDGVLVFDLEVGDDPPESGSETPATASTRKLNGHAL